jgi:hypothetical protein
MTKWDWTNHMIWLGVSMGVAVALGWRGVAGWFLGLFCGAIFEGIGRAISREQSSND